MSAGADATEALIEFYVRRPDEARTLAAAHHPTADGVCAECRVRDCIVGWAAGAAVRRLNASRRR